MARSGPIALVASPLAQFVAPLRGRPQVAAMLLFVAVVMSGNGLVAPILSVYGATFSASGTLVGFVITLFGIGRIVTNIPAGLLSQRLGRRPVLLAGPFVLVVGSIGAALATDLGSLLFWRFVQGAGSGIYMTISTAMLADMAAPAERGRLMALYQAGLLLGAGIGPAVGGVLAEHFGYTAPLWAYAIVCSFGFLFALTAVSETAERKATGKAGRRASARALAAPSFLSICAANFGIFFTRTASQWLALPLIAHEIHALRIDVIGLALALVAISNFAMLPLAGIAIDRLGAARVTLWSMTLIGVALAMLALGGLMPWFWLGLVLLGIAGGFGGPAIGAQVAEAAPREVYGPAIGILRTSGDVGFVLGPIAVGLLSDFGPSGYTSGVLANAVLMFAVAGLLATFASVRPRDRSAAIDQHTPDPT